ncbi:hypothetical protein F5Y18DRAFT_107029 [Xylariaceae sp. FL1019]|nr:hypothetical protein F5Y18DRAFT_107029 [Xylariaceae sp. FL1019]
MLSMVIEDDGYFVAVNTGSENDSITNSPRPSSVGAEQYGQQSTTPLQRRNSVQVVCDVSPSLSPTLSPTRTPQSSLETSDAVNINLQLTMGNTPHHRPYNPRDHPYHPLGSHPSHLPPGPPQPYYPQGTPWFFPGRNSSIRVVTPELTISTPPSSRIGSEPDSDPHTTQPRAEADQTRSAAMSPTQQQGGAGTASTRDAAETVPQYSGLRSRATTQSQIPRPVGRSNGNAPLALNRSPQKGKSQPRSSDRGRTGARPFEFFSSDDESNGGLSPVHEKDGSEGTGNESTGRDSHVTTMSEMIRHGMRESPPPLPPRQNHVGHQTTTPGVASSADAKPKTKGRPAPLDLTEAISYGRADRHTREYNYEHHPIKSSEAEFFNFPPQSTSSTYDNSPLSIPAVEIPPEVGEKRLSFQEQYRMWKEAEDKKPITDEPVNVKIPDLDTNKFLYPKPDGNKVVKNDDDRLPIRSPQVLLNRRSRSAMGHRELRNELIREASSTQRQPSGASDAPSSVYTGAALSYKPAMKKSATANNLQAPGSGHGMIVPSSGQASSIFPEPYTPLSAFIESLEPNPRPRQTDARRKNLFGDHGWLEDTANTVGTKEPKSKLDKAGGLLDNVLRRAREMRTGTGFGQTRTTRTLPVNPAKMSMDARAQSVLYMEIVFHLQDALNDYIKAQQTAGRLDYGKVKRISDAWASKARPKVVEFRWDLETQLELLLMHIDEFRFYGPLQIDGVIAVRARIQAMKVNARSMALHTFCSPDSVIARHVIDAQTFMTLINASDAKQQVLEAGAQMFRLCVDRANAVIAAPAPHRGPPSGGSEQRVRFQSPNSQRVSPAGDFPPFGGPSEITRSQTRPNLPLPSLPSLPLPSPRRRQQNLGSTHQLVSSESQSRQQVDVQKDENKEQTRHVSDAPSSNYDDDQNGGQGSQQPRNW